MTRTDVDAFVEKLLALYEEIPSKPLTLSLSLCKSFTEMIVAMRDELAEAQAEIQDLRNENAGMTNALADSGGSSGCGECGMSGVVVSCSTCGADKEGRPLRG